MKSFVKNANNECGHIRSHTKEKSSNIALAILPFYPRTSSVGLCVTRITDSSVLTHHVPVNTCGYGVVTKPTISWPGTITFDALKG